MSEPLSPDQMPRNAAHLLAPPRPLEFGAVVESAPFLAKVKKKAATKFRMTNVRSRQDAVALAYWLLVFHRNRAAREVCQFLGTAQFQGNYELWRPIAHALALQARFARADGQPERAVACVTRIRDAGCLAEEITGALLTEGGVSCARSRRGRKKGSNW